MQAVARVVLSDTAGTLAQQIERRARVEPPMPRLGPLRLRRQETPVAAEIVRRDLTDFNGIGGFTHDGHEYIITTTGESPTPAPWVNVLANPWFRQRRQRKRHRLYLVRKRQFVSPHAVE